MAELREVSVRHLQEGQNVLDEPTQDVLPL